MIRKTLSASLLPRCFSQPQLLPRKSTVGRPIEAGSLHEGYLDMVVYYVPVDGNLLEVTATFAPKTGGDPMRVVLGLADGDSLVFSMPGHRNSLYAFSRTGEEVTVSSGTDVHPRADALVN